MASINWIKITPILVAIAASVGLVGTLLPQAKTPAIIILVILAILSLYTWFINQNVQNEQTRQLHELETRKSQLQSEVERHRDALDDLADGLDSAVFLTDQEQTILYANQKATQLFSNPDPAGQTLLAVSLSNSLSELAQKASQSQEHQFAELTLRLPQERIVLASVWQESSRTARMFVALTDITSLRRLETVRRDFVANVSHELRTPMTTMRAMTETIQDELPPDHQAQTYLARIIKEVDRLTRIINDLLTLSVAESVPPTKELCDFADITRTIAQQLKSKADQKQIRLNLNIPPKLDISANSTQISQVVINLIDNAINYTQEGEINITLQTTPTNQAQLTITDSGIGISSDHLPRIFERFYRVDKGRSRATGGTGLGLAIVRNIIESHGGTITVESELNKGTVVTVTLPI